MSRPNTNGQPRALSLTEELEKLEQSITLTLQEIDHNFSRAHQIVTSSILPIVEQYGNHSRDVWEGSKFWKQFFESSANVSLSGYEEQPSTLDRQDETVTEDANETTQTTLETSNTYNTPTAQHISTDSLQDMDLSNLTLSPSHSTPRATNRPTSQDHSTMSSQEQSIYDQDVTGTVKSSTYQQQPRNPETPGKPTADYEEGMTTGASPTAQRSLPPPSTQRKKTDPLLHRVLDRNYRVQATPLTTSRYVNHLSQSNIKATPTTIAQNRTQQLLADDSILSSPEPDAPELHAEIFSSPQRKPARTPGVSVLTPAAARTTKNKNKTPIKSSAAGIWDDTDDDLEDDLDAFGQSPPKTMHFHVPQRRLLKTPAKEAAHNIVQDLLSTAGAGGYGGGDDDFTDEIDIDLDVDDSPSVVRQAAGLEDETF